MWSLTSVHVYMCVCVQFAIATTKHDKHLITQKPSEIIPNEGKHFAIYTHTPTPKALNIVSESKRRD